MVSILLPFSEMLNAALLILCSLFLLVLLAYLLLALTELALSFWPKPGKENYSTGVYDAVLFLPAHNEATTIAASLTRLLRQLPPSFTLVVLADNCIDDTAAVARNFAGVTVWERNCQDRKGKGHALRHGFRRLRQEGIQAEAVLVFDVDTYASAATLLVLAAAAVETQRPVQAAHLYAEASQRENALSTMGSWWSTFVREQGRSRLSLPHFMHGTGMAIPFSLLPFFDELDGSPVEDKRLTANFVISQHRPLFLPNYPVAFYENESEGDWRRRRQRWEFGHLAEIKTTTPRILLAAVEQNRFSLFFFALDFSLPPLSLLFALGSGLAAIGFLIKFPAPFLLLSGIWSGSTVLFIVLGGTRVWFSPWRAQFGRCVHDLPRWWVGKAKNYSLLLTRRWQKRSVPGLWLK